MTLSDGEQRELLLCSAILIRNRRELDRLLESEEHSIDQDLLDEAKRIRQAAPVPGEHVAVRLAQKLPAGIQYIGQRVVLLFPKVARRLLRSSGLHHQIF